MPAGAEHDRRARGASAKSVGRWIFQTGVGLDLCEADRDLVVTVPSHDHPTQQVPGNRVTSRSKNER